MKIPTNITITLSLKVNNSRQRSFYKERQISLFYTICPPFFSLQFRLFLKIKIADAELESVEDYVEKVVFVRTKKVGYLIGTAGRTIRGFENNSGAKIDIMTPNSRNQETPVLLSGE